MTWSNNPKLLKLRLCFQRLLYHWRKSFKSKGSKSFISNKSNYDSYSYYVLFSRHTVTSTVLSTWIPETGLMVFWQMPLLLPLRSVQPHLDLLRVRDICQIVFKLFHVVLTPVRQKRGTGDLHLQSYNGMFLISLLV